MQPGNLLAGQQLRPKARSGLTTIPNKLKQLGYIALLQNKVSREPSAGLESYTQRVVAWNGTTASLFDGLVSPLPKATQRPKPVWVCPMAPGEESRETLSLLTCG